MVYGGAGGGGAGGGGSAGADLACRYRDRVAARRRNFVKPITAFDYLI